MNKYHVTRVRSVLEATTVKATSESDAIAKSRKLLKKEWAIVDDKRRKGYKATKVVYPTA